MNAPVHDRYDPPPWLVALFWAFAVGSWIAGWSVGLLRTLGIAGLGFAVFGGLMVMRRLAFPRSLVIDEEGLWIPSGFLRMDVRRVLFADITEVWEVPLPFRTMVLCLRARGRTFEVNSTLMPDAESYLAVGQSICSRLEELYD